jgi:hypothetical protein
MTRIALALTTITLTLASAAQAQIVPLDRAYPSGNTLYTYTAGVPFSGIRSNLTRYPHWFRVTVAYDTTRRTVLVGCRGHGAAVVRVWTWTRRLGFGVVRCRDVGSWRVVLRRVSPAVQVESSVRFQGGRA